MAWLLRRRWYVGVAVFSYSLVHLASYFVDLGSIQAVLQGLATPIILSGWVALFIFIPMAATSDAIMTRAMGWQRWKMLQRCVYLATVLVMAHWLIVQAEPGPVILFAPLGALEFCRIWLTVANRNSDKELPQPTEARRGAFRETPKPNGSGAAAGAVMCIAENRGKLWGGGAAEGSPSSRNLDDPRFQIVYVSLATIAQGAR